ncbi:hypothetical protein KIW84_044206 [Lathyrus oleraceus]|uniref:Uncharacterized protein n=1 Tax=Pisum sativum TaxID=3888 RepID=A0A9D4XG19_PEA|nr:hypothetical protein KIW84_044206 [Pisum sativum]
MRALSVEWKNLKIKEDVLSIKAAKFDLLSQSTNGEFGLKNGSTSLFSNTSKCLFKPHTATTNPNGLGVFVDSLPSEEIPKEKSRTVPVVVESPCIDKSPKYFPSPNHMPQGINGYSGATHIQGIHQKCEVRDVSTSASYQQQGQCVPVEVSQNAVNELEPYHLELNTVKHNISLLQDSITSTGSQLTKVPSPEFFLGIDSIGQLCWALGTPTKRSCIIVDASAVLQHRKGLSVSKDFVNKFSALQHWALSEKDNYKMLGFPKEIERYLSTTSSNKVSSHDSATS